MQRDGDHVTIPTHGAKWLSRDRALRLCPGCHRPQPNVTGIGLDKTTLKLDAKACHRLIQ